MKICVVGAGAIGGLLAFRLADAGNDVSVVARGAHRDAIAAHGLTLVDHAAGGAQTLAIPASGEPRDFGVQDIVFIGLKAHAIGAMLPKIAALVGPETMVVPAINGLPWWYFQHEGGPYDGAHLVSLDPGGTMAAHLNARHLIGCVVHAAAEVREPGVVHHTGGKRFIVGEIDRALSDPVTPRVLRLAAAIDAARLAAVVSRDIRVDVWSKLIGNLSFNPVAALTLARMDRLCAHEGLLGVIRPMLLEGMAVARHYGVDLAITPDERIAVARHLGSAKISMHQDFEAQRTPEIAAIVGAVIELADKAGIAVPVTRMLYALVEERAISLGLITRPGAQRSAKSEAARP